MADSKNSGVRLLDELAALDPPQRDQLANELRKVAETFSEVPDGRIRDSQCGGKPVVVSRTKLIVNSTALRAAYFGWRHGTPARC